MPALHHRRAVLTREQARDIFLLKHYHGFVNSHAASTELSKTYQISSKAIRDIWSGRSWLDATFDMWNGDDRPTKKVLGRPKGKKDTKPRKSKSPPSTGDNGLFEKEENSILREVQNKCQESGLNFTGQAKDSHQNKEMQVCGVRDVEPIIRASSPPVHLPSINSVKAHCLASMNYSQLSTWKGCAVSQQHYQIARAINPPVPIMQFARSEMMLGGSWPSHAHNPFPYYNMSISF